MRSGISWIGKRLSTNTKTYNHLGEWAGSGTLRGNFGKWWGIRTSQSIQYEIFVARKDLEKAQAVMWNCLDKVDT